MARIENLKMDVTKGKTESKVIVTYDLKFSKSELKADFVYSDGAYLHADDEGKESDEQLAVMGRKLAYKPKKKTIKRKFKKVFKNSSLDEDSGLDDKDRERVDEIFARAKVWPATTSGDEDRTDFQDFVF